MASTKKDMQSCDNDLQSPSTFKTPQVKSQRRKQNSSAFKTPQTPQHQQQYDRLPNLLYAFPGYEPPSAEFTRGQITQSQERVPFRRVDKTAAYGIRQSFSSAIL